MDFSKRYDGPEIMDQWDGQHHEEQDRVHQDIMRANRLLGGDVAIRSELLDRLIPSGTRTCSILDAGCGDGALLRYLKTELTLLRPGTLFLFEGWDFNPEIIHKARMTPSGGGEPIVYRRVDLTGELPRAEFDLVICSLTLHHFSDEGISPMLVSLSGLARKAILVSDLERSPISYYLFYVFSRLFLRTPTARADGLTSIRKGFLPADFERYQNELPGHIFTLRWVWAFRYHWIIQK